MTEIYRTVHEPSPAVLVLPDGRDGVQGPTVVHVTDCVSARTDREEHARFAEMKLTFATDGRFCFAL